MAKFFLVSMKIFGWVIKDNISCNKQFYYALKMPVCLNPSAFGAEVAFYDLNDNLLYHNLNAFAHELHDPLEIEESRAMGMGLIPLRQKTYEETRLRIVTWSKQGNMVYILEYFKLGRKYYNVFLNLKERYQIKAIDTISRGQEYISIPAQIITKLRLCYPNFDEVEVLKTLEELGFRKEEPLIKDTVKANFFADLLPRNRWHK